MKTDEKNVNKDIVHVRTLFFNSGQTVLAFIMEPKNIYLLFVLNKGRVDPDEF